MFGLQPKTSSIRLSSIMSFVKTLWYNIHEVFVVKMCFFGPPETQKLKMAQLSVLCQCSCNETHKGKEQIKLERSDFTLLHLGSNHVKLVINCFAVKYYAATFSVSLFTACQNHSKFCSYVTALYSVDSLICSQLVCRPSKVKGTSCDRNQI